MQQSTTRSIEKKICSQGIGPGGWKCPCCAPPPGKRKQWCRAKRKNITQYYNLFEEKA